MLSPMPAPLVFALLLPTLLGPLLSACTAPLPETDGCPRSDVICTANYQPVCGEDGHSYANACSAGRACVPVAYQGECR